MRKTPKNEFQSSVVKPKGKSLANQKGQRPSSKPIKTRSNYTRENVHARVTFGFGFTSDWLKNSLSEVMQNQSNSLITFDTQLKTAPCTTLFLKRTPAKSKKMFNLRV